MCGMGEGCGVRGDNRRLLLFSESVTLVSKIALSIHYFCTALKGNEIARVLVGQVVKTYFLTEE